ncbi:nucleoside triphosphate pyrophosphohydrolase [Bacillus piscicola]|uniref:nucleoside triphosphate pyrophosphohydrolase n=1 Tax=Bacillus piscicola TaxID=1632684 RepID=UPI001F09CA04
MTNKKERPLITVIGLGSGDWEQLPLGVYRVLQNAEHLYLRTSSHPVVAELEREQLSFISFDDLYEKEEQFEEVYANIIEKLCNAADSHGHVHYAVPGHPFVAETTVQMLKKKKEEGIVELEFKGGQSFLDPVFTALQIDPNDGFQLVDATSLRGKELMMTQHIIISQVYDAFIASEVKLTLMEKYPDHYEVTLLTAAGTEEEKLQKLPLYELDRVTAVNNLTALYVPPVEDDTLLYEDFSTLREVIAILRGPNGCPWDKKQTHQSLKKYLLEETHELLDAIDEEDDEHIAEELGDVLLQVLLHAQIGEDSGYFTINDVIRTLTEKMIRRHPHVFEDVAVESADEVSKNWEAIKKEEKTDAPAAFLEDVPVSLPALMEAFELQKKAAKAGFDWNDDAPMWKKWQEEMAEWLYEIKHGTTESMKKEYGDLLFVLVNLGRYYKLHPEESLLMTNRKFRRRFQYIEKGLQKAEQTLDQASLAEMDVLWEAAKRVEKGEDAGEN